MIDLNLGPVALAFVGASGKEDIEAVKRLSALRGADWPGFWLRERGFHVDLETTESAALLIALCGCLSRGAGVMPCFATEGTQIANNLQLIAIQLKEIQQLAKLAEQISKNQLKMIHHMATASRSGMSQTDWGATFSQLAEAGRRGATGQSPGLLVSGPRPR